MNPPTEHQLAILSAYMQTGSLKDAADTLGLAVPTVKNLLSELYSRLDVGGAIEAALALGWITIPTQYQMCGWVAVCTRLRGHRGHHAGFRGHQQARAKV